MGLRLVGLSVVGAAMSDEERLSTEREQVIRSFVGKGDRGVMGMAYVAELLAELDAVREELDVWSGRAEEAMQLAEDTANEIKSWMKTSSKLALSSDAANERVQALETALREAIQGENLGNVEALLAHGEETNVSNYNTPADVQALIYEAAEKLALANSFIRDGDLNTKIAKYVSELRATARGDVREGKLTQHHES